MKHMTLPSQASLDKGSSLDPWGNLSLPTAMHVDIAQKLTEDGTPQSGIRAPDPHLFAFSQHPSHTSSHPNTGYESGQLSIQMPLPIMPPCDPPHPSLFRNASDAMSVDDGGFSGGFSGRLPGFSGIPAIPAAPPMFSAHDSTGVAQAAVFSWTHQEYCAAGDLRDLTCVEARVRSAVHPLHAFVLNICFARTSQFLCVRLSVVSVSFVLLNSIFVPAKA